MKESKSSISKAKSYEEIGEFWDNHDLSEHWDETHAADFDVALNSETPGPVAANPALGTNTFSQTPATKAVEVFYSYAHEDEGLRDELKKHLANLKRQGIITDWYDRDISAGKEWDDEIKKHLDSASVILLLISPDFMNSDYCNDVEVRRAMERHEAGEARVIPVILRPVDWKGAPFSKLQSLPSDVEPITLWRDQDEAFLDVTRGIRKAVQELSRPSASVPTIPEIPRPPRVGFVSRRDKDGHNIVERLREELAPHKNQIVALWGAGGVGKTALAAEAVRPLGETSGQRIIWISADGRANFTFSTLLDGIAEQLGRTDLRPLVLGLKEEALRPLIAAAPTLIILDNLETISPQEELLCKDFLARNAGCPALITTRERIDNAHLITIAAMAPDEASELLDKLIVQTHDPDVYAEVDRNRILENAEFNPLIIQWIVGQIDLAQDPEEVLSDLAHGEGDAAQRVFDRSFELPQMADGGRVVLMALSLFMPSATRPALAEVAGMATETTKKKFKKAQQTLASLWLVKQTDGGRRLVVEGLTRELAKARLDRDQLANALRRRFVSRFMKYAEANARSNASDLNALEREKDNLLAAMDVAFQIRAWLDVTRIINAAKDFQNLRGYWDDAIRYGEQATVAARMAGNEWQRALLAANTARFRNLRGEYDKSRQAYEEALEFFRRVGNQPNVASALHQIGAIELRLGKLKTAEQFFLQSLEIRKTLDDHRGMAQPLQNLGLIAYRRGDLAEARRLYSEASDKEQDLSQFGMMLEHLARFALDEGKLGEARQQCNESLEIRKKLGDQLGIASASQLLGTIETIEGDCTNAENLVTQSIGIFRALAVRGGISNGLAMLGDLRVRQDLFREAQDFYYEALQEAEAANDGYLVGQVKRSLGLLAQKQGDKKQAMILLQESIDIFKEIAPGRAKDTEQLLTNLTDTT